ncbi:MAG: fatty acid cis/trans isomerase [Pirellulales bacterium]|nr:fatty acid cis/trans isomerase [Pirellulales bacterium]
MSIKNKLELGVVLIAFVVLAGIAAIGVLFYEASSDKTSWRPFVLDPPAYPEQTATLEDGFYLDRVQPILNRRCIACHGCLDSPCNLKMTSYEGVMRGAKGDNVDDPHLFTEEPIRLYDAPSLDAWRERGFCEVIDREAPPMERPSRSVLYRMIATGAERNQPSFNLAPLEPVYQRADEHLCPCIEGIDDYLKQRPAAGMPFGLPGLSQEELGTFSRWIVAGAPGPTRGEMAARRKSTKGAVIQRWESFLNQSDPRSSLVSRYIFEHVFLASINFEQAPGEFYKLVRSVTPPGEYPIRRIITARPFDTPYLPGIKKCYYRLQKVTSSYVQKSFFLWSLSDQMLTRLEALFYKTQWPEGGDLNPGYGSHNPFEVFAAMPAKSRSLFLLENSKLIASGMIRGPVCVGNLATYAIKDYFWVFFVNPDSDPSVKNPELGLKSWTDFMSFAVWGNAAYEKAYAKTLATYKPNGYSIEDIWDGDKENLNAWLTILRNETNATVLHGRKGGIPPTFWLIDYSGYERLYYSLVADYQYWGGEQSKIATWEFMGYLRQEFEDNFLRLLPEQDRAEYRKRWTRGIGQELLFTMPFPGESGETDVPLSSRDPISQVLTLIQGHLTDKVSGPADPLNSTLLGDVQLESPIRNVTDWERAVSRLSMRTGESFTPFLPSVSYLRIRFGDRWEVYTLIANRSYAFNDVIFDENGARQPKLDTLSVYKGLVGDFPNLFVSLSAEEASDCLVQLRAVDSAAAWQQWKEKYGTLRNSRPFWPVFDWFTDWNFANQSPQAGHLDLRYYNLLDSDF